MVREITLKVVVNIGSDSDELGGADVANLLEDCHEDVLSVSVERERDREPNPGEQELVGVEEDMDEEEFHDEMEDDDDE